MPDYAYDSELVADPFSFQRAANSAITIYDANDAAEASPLALKDLKGLALPNPLTSSAEAFVPAFVAGTAQVKMVGGGLRVVRSSFQGVRDEAVAAKLAAEEAASDAAEAAAHAQAPTDVQVDAGVARADIPGQIGQVLPPLVAPIVPPLVAQAIANDPTVANSAATMAQSATGLIPKWKANTAYAAAQMVVAPSGDLVTAKVAFTSGASYSDANWNLSTAASMVASSLKNKGVLANGTDINTLRDTGIYYVASSTAAATMPNLPFTTPGRIIVTKDPGATLVTQNGIGIPLTGGNISLFTRTTRSATLWDSGWESDRQVKGALPDGTNLTTFATAGTWIITSAASAATMSGLPQLDGVTVANVAILHISTYPGISAGEEEITVYVADGNYAKFSRVRRIASSWPGWQHDNPAPLPPTVTAVSDSGLAHTVLMDNFTQKMGGIILVDTPTIAFRFDHGLANFNNFVRAIFEAFNWKYSLALCSGQWDRAENLGVTPSTVNAWVLAGLAEIWNHTKDHGSGDNSEAAWQAAILDGLRELESQIPAAAGKIFGLAPPGSAGTNFGGFIFGQTLEEFVDSDGIRFMLRHHPIVAGYLATEKRVQDGRPRQGMGHRTMDTFSLSDVQTYVEQAKATKTAMQFMLHPSRLNTAGYMSTSTLTTIMDYVRAEELAGNIKVVSPYEQLLCSVV